MIIEEFIAKDTENKNRLFVKVRCEICNNVFSRQKRKLKTHTCSPKCLSLFSGKSKQVSCAHCRKTFIKSVSEINKSKSGYVFCSRKCKDIGQTYIKEIQPNHYGTGKGLYSYRDKAIKNYGNKCQMCGYDNPLAIVVHHIDHNRNNNEIDNLIVLCANCHAIAHSIK